MNEKLEREIIRYEVPFVHPAENLDETTLDAIAKHFYNLALESVKDELGKMIIDAPISAQGHQRVFAYNLVVDYINSLLGNK